MKQNNWYNNTILTILVACDVMCFGQKIMKLQQNRNKSAVHVIFNKKTERKKTFFFYKKRRVDLKHVDLKHVLNQLI